MTPLPPPPKVTKPISLSNRFKVLTENDESNTDDENGTLENVDMKTFGDGIVRSLVKEIYSNKCKNKGYVHVSPGANISRINDTIKQSRADYKESCLIACVGSNNAFQRNAAREEIIYIYTSS